jgi:methylated-DNA-protein-cysteine methyltransferase-like protein
MASSTSDHRSYLDQLFVQMHAVIRSIPRGSVATYGQIAELAGLPGGARVAAASLKAGSANLPWQRVIAKASGTRGRIAIHDPVGAAVQRQLLEEEGVVIGERGLIRLDVYGWLPGAARRRARGGSSRAASPRPPPRSGSTRRASSSRR